jgi:small subunit ribosomal protein S20
MANHEQAVKRARQNITKRAHNRHFSSILKGSVKKIRAALSESDGSVLGDLLKAVSSTMDKSVTKGIITKNKASRLIGRLSQQVHSKLQNTIKV